MTGTFIFMALFAVLVLPAYGKRRKPALDEAARLPLDEDDLGVDR